MKKIVFRTCHIHSRVIVHGDQWMQFLTKCFRHFLSMVKSRNDKIRVQCTQCTAHTVKFSCYYTCWLFIYKIHKFYVFLLSGAPNFSKGSMEKHQCKREKPSERAWILQLGNKTKDTQLLPVNTFDAIFHSLLRKQNVRVASTRMYKKKKTSRYVW